MNLIFEPLTERHDVTSFRSGATYLDEYLKNDALAEQSKDYARSFVALDSDNGAEQVVGYFTLKLSPQSLPQLSDDWVCVAELACLARDKSVTGQGVGTALLFQALQFLGEISQRIGFPEVYLYATTEGIPLYESHGFIRISEERKAYFMSLTELKAILSASVHI